MFGVTSYDSIRNFLDHGKEMADVTVTLTDEVASSLVEVISNAQGLASGRY